jgi:hypothetical protein
MCSTIKKHRSESSILLGGPGAGNVVVEDCETNNGGCFHWSAASGYAVGQLIKGTDGITKTDGMTHVVAMTSGDQLTGGTEPDWNSIYGPSVLDPYQQDGGSMVAGRNTLDTPNAGPGLNDWMIMVDDAGALDALGHRLPVFGYAQYHAAGVDAFGANHASAYLTLHTGTGGAGAVNATVSTVGTSRVRGSPAIVDNHVTFMLLDFIVVIGDNTVRRSRFDGGRLDVGGGWPKEIIGNSWTRDNWFPFRRLNQGNGGEILNKSFIQGNIIGWGAWPVPRPYSMQASPLVNNPNYPNQRKFNGSGVGGPTVLTNWLIFPSMALGLVRNLVGIGRDEWHGTDTALESAQDKKQNVLCNLTANIRS